MLEHPEIVEVDAALIARSRRDPEVFAEIFERHFDAVHSYLARRTDSRTADDLAAEVFLTAFRSRSRYDDTRPHALPWLYGIAHNLLLHHQRSISRKIRAIARLGQPPEEGDHSDHVVESVDAAHAAQTLSLALSRLAPIDREAFLLNVVERLSYAEIAEVVQVPLGTVKSRIARSRSQLQEHMSQIGKVPSTTRRKGHQDAEQR